MAETNWSNLVANKELKSVYNERSKTYIEKKGWMSSLADEQADGWEYAGDYSGKTKSGGQKIKLRKEKKFDEQFEDAVWTMFYKMGFNLLNKDRRFTIYDPDSAYSQQIDVFAADDETVLVVECKASEVRKAGTTTFKKPIEALGGNKDMILKQIKKRPEFQGKKLKFIWATKNISLDHNDIARLQDYKIAYFDDDAISYYTKLADLLGTAARYQLLGDIFKGAEIKGMDMKVPAIEGKMGPNKFYSFNIEPGKLLKIGYILHNSLAGSGEMENYQRLISKSRLTGIRKYINKGGTFPNSIIVSIDTDNKPLKFEPAGKDVQGALSRIGTLYLPNRYQSAYVIDGQHRLYGFSDTDHLWDTTVPVIAFVDLDGHKQMQMFMDINENQKAVPKQLRVVLEASLGWNSLNKNEQKSALYSKIAQQLGADRMSALNGRVIENESTLQTDIVCVTLSALKSALLATNFVPKYASDNKQKSAGTFDCGSNDATYKALYPFIRDMLNYIQEHCPDEWNKGSAGGLLAMNRGIQACIRLVGDIVDMLVKDEKIHPRTDDSSYLYPEVEAYLDPLIAYINGINAEQRRDLLKYAGSGADVRFWRMYQKAVHDSRPEFNPDGLEQYLEDQTQKYNAQARAYLIEIEKSLRKTISGKMQETYGSSWESTRIPRNLYSSATATMASKNYDITNGLQQGPLVTVWDCVPISDFDKIISYSTNWSGCLNQILVRPEDAGKPGDKDAKTAWIGEIADIQRHLNGPMSAQYSVKKSDFDTLESIHKWLCE